MLYNNITELIGNTPILKIDEKVHGLKNVNLYVKLELFNPFGSLKDRAAYYMLKDDIEDIKKNGQTVIESSSGNTAKALDIIASINGIKFKTVTNRIKVPETKNILKVMGAEIDELPGISECPDPTDPNDPVQYIERMIVEEPEKYFHTSQYTNLKNPAAHYNGTGKEIYNDVGKVDYFFGTVGTTGSSRGISEYLQEKNPSLKKIGIIATKGDNIPGIRNMDEMYEVGIFDKSLYNDVVAVNSMDAIESMLTLIRKCGVLGGPTSGACYRGALDYLKNIDDKLEKPITAVFVACDRVEWYMSYIEKRRPDIFDESIKKDSIRSLTKKDLDNANILNIDNIQEWIDKNKPLIIDLRGNLAYRNGHIKGSINITDSFFEDIVDNGVPFSKENMVLLVCPVGDKSKQFTAFLNKKGYNNVYSLEGGVTQYRDKGYPLQREIKSLR